MHAGLATFFEENPDTAQAIVMKAVEGREGPEGRQEGRGTHPSEVRARLDGAARKLADCQSRTPATPNCSSSRGDSAGGSAKQGRNPDIQAILPLGGKIMNVEKHRLDRILEHDEIRHMITAIGTGIGDEFDIEGRRYEKIVMMTDADVDGHTSGRSC